MPTIESNILCILALEYMFGMTFSYHHTKFYPSLWKIDQVVTIFVFKVRCPVILKWFDLKSESVIETHPIITW